MKTKLTLTLALAASMAWAQMPGPRLPPTDLVKSYLTLTDAQITSLTQIRQQGAESRRTAMQDIHTKQQALHDALDKGTGDATSLGRLLLDIQALQKKIADMDKSDQQLALNILTPPQKTQLKALQDAANLQPTIGQAAGLGLLDRPAQNAMPGAGPGGMGPGMGMGMGSGMGMGGPGMGPMMMRSRPGTR
jgi:Spy/CpxP family protein refolding chaperone